MADGAHPSPIDPDILRRFPELGLIDDEDVRNETGRLIEEHVQPWFWDAPAASSYKHHSPWCCAKHGLWIHTKMAFTAFHYFAESDLATGRLSEDEADLGRAAILVHDLRKYGEQYYEGKHSDKDHDLQASIIVRKESDLDDRVADAVASHMGADEWGYAGPEPETPLEWLVHRADMAASTKQGTFGVYEPHEDIREMYPAIPRAEL